MTVSMSLFLCFPHPKRTCKTPLRDSPKYNVTIEEMISWGEKFESLLNHRDGRRLLREFLKSEYSEENILFYEAVLDLEKTVDEDEIFDKCKTIYDDYISTESSTEVSLDSLIRDAIDVAMINPNTTMFQSAKQHIYDLMKRDSFSRFKSSAIYSNALRELRQYHRISVCEE